MSSKHLSPTAAALRSSRLFSLPAALPPLDSASSGFSAAGKTSNTATASRPTQQAITTPSRSLGRGDWGLKRPLPLRSTARTSTPLLRVNAIDTREHITDYASAADLSITLQKFQELGLSITKPERASNSSTALHRSVFEPERDHTDPDCPPVDPQTGREVKRWKHQGPYLAGMTETDFQDYVHKALKGRKQEFLAFVRREGDRRLPQERLSQRTFSGESSDSVEREVGDSPMTDAEFDEFIRALRSAGTRFETHSDLARMVNDFLDLPGTSALQSHFSDIATQSSDSPPPMHSSGGLGFLRTDSVLRNHHVFGPQAAAAPQVARVLHQPSHSSSTERLGIAGFVVDGVGDTRRNLAYPYPEKLDPGLDPQLARDVNGRTIGLAVEGGNRIWVEPRTASIDDKGRVQIDVRSAAGDNVGAHQMNPDLFQVLNGRMPKTMGSTSARPLVRSRDVGLDKSDSREQHKSAGAYGMSSRAQDLGDTGLAAERHQMAQLLAKLKSTRGSKK